MFEAASFWKEWQKDDGKEEKLPSSPAVESAIRIFTRLSAEQRRSRSPLRRALRRIIGKGKD